MTYHNLYVLKELQQEKVYVWNFVEEKKDDLGDNAIDPNWQMYK